MMPTSPGSEVQALPQASHDNPGAYQCSLCPKRFTRAFNLRSHVLSHTNERPFLCTFCGSAFVRHNDRREHEKTHDAAAARHFICQGTLKDGSLWGCGRHFARSTNLARHHRCQKGRACIAAALLEKAHNQACATAHRQSLVPTLSVTPAMPTVAETVYTIVPADNFQPPATGTDSLASYQSHLQVEHRAKILESILTSKGK